LEILKEQTDDPPSGVLAERCRLFLRTPPPGDWDGVFVAMSK
jgi:adenylate cyclase